MQPVRFVHKGRGAVSNPQGRFERDTREPVGDGWAREPDDTDVDEAPGTVVTPDAARSIVARNTSPDIGFDASINPYRGCEHGCAYCYARPGHAFLGLSPGLDFETRLFAKMEAPALLEAELARPGHRPEPIAIGTVTDAWQPVERRLRLTRGCLEVFARTRHPVSLITKSSLVERDLDLLAPMARDGLAYAMITVTTLDPALSRILEPRAPAPWRRLETIRRLADAGVPVGVSLAPIIPFVNEPEIEAILDAVHAAGARYANYVVLRLPFELVEVVHGWLREHFPDRADRVVARLRDLRGGRDNDPRFGWRMKGQGPWADLIRSRFDARLRRWGSGRERPTLRTDLFRAPARPSRPSRPSRPHGAASPTASESEVMARAVPGRGGPSDEPPRQGSLF
jgi:DNA repair photolyase